MFHWTRSRAAAQRFAARREREDLAPRLHERIPTLKALDLAIRHEVDGRPFPGTNYVRRIAVASCPALFWVPCSDSKCVRGGHDITRTVLHGLSARETEFEGSDRCSGEVGSESCIRELHFVARATFLAPSTAPLAPAERERE